MGAVHTKKTETPKEIDASKVPSAFSLIGKTVDVVKQNPLAFAFLVVLPILLTDPASTAIAKIDTSSMKSFDEFRAVWQASVSATAIALAIAGTIFTIIVQPGVVLATLRSLKQKEVDAISVFIEGLRYFWRYLGLSILSSIILIGSFLLFIVPFFLVLPRITLAPMYLVDRNMGVMDALRASWNETRGNTRFIWALIGVLILAAIPLSILANIPVVGILATIAGGLLSAIAPIIRYKQLETARK